MAPAATSSNNEIAQGLLQRLRGTAAVDATPYRTGPRVTLRPRRDPAPVDQRLRHRSDFRGSGAAFAPRYAPRESLGYDYSQPQSLSAIRQEDYIGDPAQLAAELKERQGLLEKYQMEEAALISQLEQHSGPDINIELEKQASKASELAAAEETKVRNISRKLQDMRSIENAIKREKSFIEAEEKQRFADEKIRPEGGPLPSNVSLTVKDSPEFLGGQTGLVGRIVSETKKELSRPYSPYDGERIAQLDPLELMAQSQARRTHARETALANQYNASTDAIRGTMGERTYDKINPLMQQAMRNPDTEVDRFRTPYDREYSKLQDRMNRNLTENILPAIRSQISVRSGHRGMMEERAVRNLQETLAQEGGVLHERAVRLARNDAQQYALHNLQAAHVASNIHTRDVSRIADTAQVLHRVGTDEHKRNLGGADTLSRLGLQHRDQAQRVIDSSLAAHAEKEAYKLKQLATASNIAYGVPTSSQSIELYSQPRQAQPDSRTTAGAFLAALGSEGMRRKAEYKGGRIGFSSGGSTMKSSPFQRGSDEAMESIRRHKQKLEEASVEADRHGSNPIWPFLTKSFLGMAASRNPNALQAFADSANDSFGTYENAIKSEEARKKRAYEIHEKLVETQQIEQRRREENKYHRDLLGETSRHNKQTELIGLINAGVDPSEVAGLNFGGNSSGTSDTAGTTPGTNSPITPGLKSFGPNSYFVPKKEDRTKEKDVLGHNLAYYDKGYRLLKHMKEIHPDTGIHRLGTDNAIVTTLGNKSGKIDTQEDYNQSGMDLVRLGSAHESKGGSKAVALMKIVQDSKPNTGKYSRVGLEKIHNNLLNTIMIDRNIDQFKQELIEKRVADHVMTKAISAWEASEPYIRAEDGEIIGFKRDIREFLPEDLKLRLGYDFKNSNPEVSKKSESSQSNLSEEQQIAALEQENARIKARLGK